MNNQTLPPCLLNTLVCPQKGHMILRHKFLGRPSLPQLQVTALPSVSEERKRRK